MSGGSTPALKEQILNVLDDLDTMYGEIFNDPESEVAEAHLSTLSDLVERLDKLVNHLPEDTESAGVVSLVEMFDTSPDDPHFGAPR